MVHSTPSPIFSPAFLNTFATLAAENVSESMWILYPSLASFGQSVWVIMLRSNGSTLYDANRVLIWGIFFSQHQYDKRMLTWTFYLVNVHLVQWTGTREKCCTLTVCKSNFLTREYSSKIWVVTHEHCKWRIASDVWNIIELSNGSPTTQVGYVKIIQRNWKISNQIHLLNGNLTFILAGTSLCGTVISPV